MKFDKYVLEICSKAGRKLNAFARMLKLISFRKRRTLKIFIESQFKFCPLVWIFCNSSTSNRVNRLHELALSIVYNIMTFNLRLKVSFLKEDISVFTIRTFKYVLLKYTMIHIIFQQIVMGIYLLEITKI